MNLYHPSVEKRVNHLLKDYQEMWQAKLEAKQSMAEFANGYEQLVPVVTQTVDKLEEIVKNPQTPEVLANMYFQRQSDFVELFRKFSESLSVMYIENKVLIDTVEPQVEKIKKELQELALAINDETLSEKIILGLLKEFGNYRNDVANIHQRILEAKTRFDETVKFCNSFNN